MGGAPDIPQRDLGKELSSILSFMPQFVQKTYGLTGRFGPKFAERDIEQLTKFGPQYAGLGFDISKQFAPKYAGLGADVTRQFAPEYAGIGYDISKQFAPQYLGLNLGQMQRNIAGQPILSELNRQAQAQLGLQGMPSEDELRRATQAQQAGFAARGMTYGPQSVAADVLTRDELVRQRAREAQQFATGVQGLNLSQLQGLGGVAQMPNLAGYATPPNLAAYAGAPNLPAYVAPGASTQPMASAIGALSGVTNTLFPFASDVFSSNQSAAGQSNIAAANKGGGLTGAGIGALGSLGAAAIGL